MDVNLHKSLELIGLAGLAEVALFILDQKTCNMVKDFVGNFDFRYRKSNVMGMDIPLSFNFLAENLGVPSYGNCIDLEPVHKFLNGDANVNVVNLDEVNVSNPSLAAVLQFINECVLFRDSKDRRTSMYIYQVAQKAVNGEVFNWCQLVISMLYKSIETRRRMGNNCCNMRAAPILANMIHEFHRNINRNSQKNRPSKRRGVQFVDQQHNIPKKVCQDQNESLGKMKLDLDMEQAQRRKVQDSLDAARKEIEGYRKQASIKDTTLAKMDKELTDVKNSHRKETDDLKRIFEKQIQARVKDEVDKKAQAWQKDAEARLQAVKKEAEAQVQREAEEQAREQVREATKQLREQVQHTTKQLDEAREQVQRVTKQLDEEREQVQRVTKQLDEEREQVRILTSKLEDGRDVKGNGEDILNQEDVLKKVREDILALERQRDELERQRDELSNVMRNCGIKLVRSVEEITRNRS